MLPAAILQSQVFAVLAAFVAINTVMYGALALGKMLPKVYPTDWVTSRNRRAENRSIHPEVSPAGSEDGGRDQVLQSAADAA
jgi:hypothetical protein